MKEPESPETYLADLKLSAVKYVTTTESTNDDAHCWLDQGAPDMSVVIADEQTRGRGRFQRRWHTPPGAGLASSLIIHPTVSEKESTHLFSPLAGVAVANTLEKLFSIHPQIKWPNDVLVGGKKICGILSETAWIGEDLVGVVVGTGINISPDAIPPVEYLTFPATCVQMETQQAVDRREVLHEYLSQMISWREKLGSAEFFEYWRTRLAFRGMEVEIQGALGNEVEGVLEDIDMNGDLLIRSSDGMVPVKVGDVRLRLRQK